MSTRQILTKYPDSMFGCMFSGRVPLQTDKNGHYFIDRDGEKFKYILNFLRDGSLNFPEDLSFRKQLYSEIDFFQLNDMMSSIEAEKNTNVCFSPLLKHTAIHLSNQLSTAEHVSWHTNWASVLIRPAATEFDKITFHVDALDWANAMQIGLFTKIPQQFTRTPDVSISPNGAFQGKRFDIIYAAEDVNRTFKKGDLVTIILDITSFSVTFFVGENKIASMKLNQTKKINEIYFGVSMWWKNKVSIVNPTPTKSLLNVN